MQSFTKNAKEFLALDNEVLALFIAVLLITLGEELWTQFLPSYFLALGGSVFALGVFKSFTDALGTVSQLPGGVISDKLGRLSASILFFSMGILGYFIYLTTSSWELLFIGAILVQGTSNLLQPTIFSIIGDRLPSNKRTNAFSVQSILKRLPIIIAPVVGGYFIEGKGTIAGIQTGLLITIVFTVIGLVLIWSSNKTGDFNNRDTNLQSKKLNRYVEKNITVFNRRLAYLLSADILARFGQAMVSFFIVIHVIDLFGAQTLGYLISLRVTTSILSYLPAAAIAEKIGRKPVIFITFLCFAIYPGFIILSTTLLLLIIGYIIFGMKEFGEPARKALIVNLSDVDHRGKSVGLYYTIRSLAIIPAGVAGSFLWSVSPQFAGIIASGIGGLGVIVFGVFVHE